MQKYSMWTKKQKLTHSKGKHSSWDNSMQPHTSKLTPSFTPENLNFTPTIYVKVIVSLWPPYSKLPRKVLPDIQCTPNFGTRAVAEHRYILSSEKNCFFLTWQPPQEKKRLKKPLQKVKNYTNSRRKTSTAMHITTFSPFSQTFPEHITD